MVVRVGREEEDPLHAVEASEHGMRQGEGTRVAVEARHPVRDAGAGGVQRRDALGPRGEAARRHGERRRRAVRAEHLGVDLRVVEARGGRRERRGEELLPEPRERPLGRERDVLHRLRERPLLAGRAQAEGGVRHALEFGEQCVRGAAHPGERALRVVHRASLRAGRAASRRPKRPPGQHGPTLRGSRRSRAMRDAARLLLLPRPRRLVPGAGEGAPSAAAAEIRADAALGRDAFTIEIGGGAVRIRHGAGAARRYAEETLRQIRRQAGAALPALRIEDAPDFPVRGTMLDVSRDRVPTRETLARLVELMARLRLNHLELYTEHTFAYRGHEAVWRDASPMTPDDVRWLDAVCRERDVELCANQNTFGHMGRWLQHPAYRPRAEAPEGFTTKLGVSLPPGVLAPTPENADFALALCRELLACHTSRRIHVGCDETFELGRGR